MENNIHFVKTYVIEQKDSDNENLVMIQEYDRNGNIISTQEYDENGNLIFEHLQEFNANNKIISESIVSYKDDYNEKKTFTYNDKGELDTEKIEYDGGWFSQKKYEYDVESNIIKITSLDEEDELEEMIVMEFNDKKQIVCRKEYDEYGKLKEMVKNEYNDDGTVSLKQEYNNKESLEKSHEYVYNDNGKLFGVKIMNRKGKVLDWVKFEYNDENEIIEQLNMSGAKISITYDKVNNSSKETHFDPKDNITSETTLIKNEEGNILEEHSLDKFTKYVYEYF